MQINVRPIRNVSFAQIEVTTRCNFTCGFCSGRHMPQADIDYDLFLRTLERLPELTHLDLQGEGEPLMHPRFFDMLEATKRRGIHTYFITNGSLFSSSAIEKILQANVRHIAVSIESPEPKEFQRIRGGKLQKVLRGIRQLLTARRELGLEGPAVGFAVMVMRSTISSFERILELYEELGMDGGVSVQTLQRMSQYTRHYPHELHRELLDESEDTAIKSRAWEAIAARQISPKAIGFHSQLFRGWKPASKTCPWLAQGLYVGRDGTAVACCMMKDPERHNLGGMDEAAESSVLGRRSDLAIELAEGRTPDVCTGCAIVELISRVEGQRPPEPVSSRVRLPLA
jgi:MoaA/NifB/PqqE/SkfB family radical SAM enzyme